MDRPIFVRLLPSRRLLGKRPIFWIIILFILWINLGILLYVVRLDDKFTADKAPAEKDYNIVAMEKIFAPTAITEDSYYKRDNFKSNPHDYQYMINQPHFCDGLSEQPYILVEIHSRPHGQERRTAIRDTWGSKQAFSRMNRTAALIFLVGRGKTPEENQYLTTESTKHHDIVQEDFTDSYENLTIKSIMGMKWAAMFCPGATYVLKTDDDMFMNIAALEMILEPVNTTGVIGGALNRGAKVMRGGRWRVTEQQFPFASFPLYCAGAAYVASLDVAKVIYETSEFKRRFDIEDAYVTGVIPKIAGLTPLGLPGFPFWITRLREDNLCKVKENTLIGIHALPPGMMRQTWTKFLDMKAQCQHK